MLDEVNFKDANLPSSSNLSNKISASEINFTNVDFRNRSYNFKGVNLTDAIFEGVKIIIL